jgi:hypothetical protein
VESQLRALGLPVEVRPGLEGGKRHEGVPSVEWGVEEEVMMPHARWCATLVRLAVPAHVVAVDVVSSSEVCASPMGMHSFGVEI